jgi:hypothetical protein
MFYKGLTLSTHDSGWLAFYIRKRLEEQRATAGEYIENELRVSQLHMIRASRFIYRNASSPFFLPETFETLE